MTLKEKILLAACTTTYLCIFVFSWAYVDLNLTISSNKTVLYLINLLQHVAYFNRPQASAIYLILVTIAFGLFFVELSQFKKGELSNKYFLIRTLSSFAILLFAYPFLSYDIFNYLVDAKIIFKYHLSPYTHRALDFPLDDWTRFMRWTHRYSPYGPLWLVYSQVPTIIGLGKFVLTLFSFKLFISIFHLVNIYFLYKILKSTKVQNLFFPLSLYALNPLFLIEGIANAHNDVVFSSLIIGAIYTLTTPRKSFSVLFLIIGFLVKYLTILIAPIFILHLVKPNLATFKRLLALTFFILFAFMVIFSSIKISVPFVNSGSTQVQFQPWYLFWALPIVPLLGYLPLTFAFLGLSAGAMLRYLPYLYYGDWSHAGTVYFMQIVTVAMTILFFAYSVLRGSSSSGQKSEK